MAEEDAYVSSPEENEMDRSEISSLLRGARCNYRVFYCTDRVSIVMNSIFISFCIYYVVVGIHTIYLFVQCRMRQYLIVGHTSLKFHMTNGVSNI
jgi:hypothetical protein